MTVGLRERKKLRTRNAIQKEALRLFLKKGFEETTIEDIAEAVEISPSTFFNYFPSKEAVVFQDDLDPLILAEFAAQPAGVSVIGALRRAMKKVLSRQAVRDDAFVRERIELVTRTPELRAAMLDQFAQQVEVMAELIARRAGKDPNDFAVRNMAGALLGVLIAAYFATAEHPGTDFIDQLDRAMAHLERGLPL
ncbi:MAG TPA: TetR family transcriptional regulator [Candidatus Dormibacteraeota bacterium]|nr:TetR family transcriptional regulator [Candidatus Dormibacteraeota bacterium]